MIKKIYRHSIKFTALIVVFSFIALAAGIISIKQNITLQKSENTGIPSLSINTESNRRIRSKKKYIKASFYDGNFSGGCKIRGHGNSTWRLPKAKKPYLLKLNKKHGLLGMAPAEKWILFANLSDATSLRNSYATYLARNVFTNQRYIPDYRFANIFINGRYEGLYCIFEKVEEEQMSFNSPESFIFEVNHRNSRTWTFNSKQGISFCIHNNDIPEEQYLVEKNIIQDFEDILYSPDFKDDYKGYKNRMDMDSFVDWYLINEFTKNKDADFEFSCYLYFDAATKKIGMGPIWDFDLSCGGNFEQNFSYEKMWVNQKGWFKRLFEDENFQKAVKDRWNERKHLLQESFEWIDQNGKRISDAAELNDSVWKTFGHKQWPHIPGWRKRKTHKAHVDYMKTWLSSRYKWLDKEINRIEEDK